MHAPEQPRERFERRSGGRVDLGEQGWVEASADRDPQVTNVNNAPRAGAGARARGPGGVGGCLRGVGRPNDFASPPPWPLASRRGPRFNARIFLRLILADAALVLYAGSDLGVTVAALLPSPEAVVQTPRRAKEMRLWWRYLLAC